MKDLNKEVKCICPSCRQESIVKVNDKDYENWRNGELIQRSFPYLSPDERELLITGICPECWDKMFKGW